MWNFLRRGQGGAAAADALRELNQDLARLASGLSVDQVLAAHSYMMWAEKAEERLLAIFQGFAIPRQLYSDRYWQIRVIDDATRRPLPLIRAEIEVQKRFLDELLAQLDHYLPLLALSSDHSIVVLDTNVYVRGKMFHEVNWQQEVGTRRATIAMPLVVLDELDLIKDRDDGKIGKRAQGVLRALDAIADGTDWLTPIPIRQNVQLQLLDEPPGHQRQKGHDDEIVRQSGYFAQLNDNRLTLITRDRGMRLRAQASGLTSKTLPSHLERDQETDHG